MNVGTRRHRTVPAAALTAAVLAAAVGLAQPADPLERFAIGRSGPGWDGIELGMSLVKAERLLETTLAISPGESRPVCSEFAAEADWNGLRLVLGFPTARPGAKIESIWVRFEGAQIAATKQRLIESLRARAPEISWIPDPAHPEATESDDPTPVYLLGGSPPAVVKIRPQEGIQIALRPCLERESR